MNTIKLLFTTVFLLVTSLVYSAIAPTHERISTISSPVTIGQPTATKTVAIPLPLTGISKVDAFRKGIITLGVDHHYPQHFSAMKIKVVANVKRWSNVSSSSPNLSDTLINLHISYAPNDSLSFKDKHSMVIENLEKYSVTIQEIFVNDVSVTTLPANLFIDLDLFVDRYYDLTPQINNPIAITFPITATHRVDLDCDGVDDILRLTWPTVVGAEEYQLEWTYINDYTNGTSWKPMSSLPFNFKLNSTRISTTHTSYDISLIYDHGYICYRVRAVGRDLSNLSNRVFGIWSTSDEGIVNNAHYFHQNWSYEGDKNWQYSSTFAEEGKRKEVISYFDGTLRNRQMVTRINSNEKVIVGETIYDHQGRPAIQVLPVPVDDPTCVSSAEELASLKYYPNFNINGNSDAYSASDFDLSLSNDSCNVSSGTMKNTSGASYYYSTNNSNTSDLNGYIPTAENRPFSQVEYTPDNTGRIKRQSGVGETFKLGSGHETSYYYGQPDQIQLSRMFGSEVGNYAHYQKNMVVDANGQVSVSYLDQEGRVIATSLAGESPTNLNALSSATEYVEITAQLFDASENDKNVLSINNKSKIFNSTFLVASAGTYYFDYDLSVETFKDSCLKAGICFDCLYDFEIIIQDECGVNLVSGSNLAKLVGRFVDENDSIKFFIDCAGSLTPTELEESFSVYLPIGSYSIQKVLTVNEDALDFYLTEYLDTTNNHCVKTLQDFEDEFLAATDFTDCDIYIDCDECLTVLGSLENYLLLDKGDVDDYNAEVEKCNLICEDVTLADVRKLMLLADLRPGGQYAQYQDANGVNNPNLSKLSIYNNLNQLPEPQASWKNPKMLLNGSFLYNFFEEDSITISRIPLEVTLVSNVVTATVPTILNLSNAYLDPVTNTYYTYPQYLSNYLDFIAAWKDSWAYSLLVYHPEYGYYKSDEELKNKVNTTDAFTSNSFDQLLTASETWLEAKNKGFINASNALTNWFVQGATPWDPFVVHSATAYNNYGSELSNKFSVFHTEGSNSYSMPELAAMITRCPSLMSNASIPSACRNFGADVTGQSTAYSDSIRNLEWNKLVGFYTSAKQEAIQNMMDYRSINVAGYKGYNACIGTAEFDPFELGYYDPILFVNSEFFSPTQTCNYANYILYKDKQKRYGTGDDYISYDPEIAAQQLFLQTGQCPTAYSLQAFLNEAVRNQNFATSTTSIQNNLMFGPFLRAINDNNVATPIDSHNWNVTSATSTQLIATFEHVSSSSQIGTIMFTKSVYPCASFDWSDIVQIATFKPTTIVGANYNFEALVRFNTPTGQDTCRLFGSTTFDIKNCTFEPICEKNQFTKDLQILLNALAVQNQLLTSVQVLGASNAYDNLISPFIKKEIYNPSITAAYWSFDGINGRFNLKRGISASEALQLNVNSITPASANTSLIRKVAAVKVINDNLIEVIVNDASNNYLATIVLTITYWNGTTSKNVPLGACSLADPLTCQGEKYDNLKDISKLLQNVLINQKGTTSYNLFASTHFSEAPLGWIDMAATSTQTTQTTVTVSSIIYDTITFTQGVNCKIQLWTKNNYVRFDNLLSIGEFLPYGTSNNSNENTRFYALASTNDPDGFMITDTIFGNSCLSIAKCEVCFVESPVIFDNDKYCQNLYDLYLGYYAEFISNQTTTNTCGNYAQAYPIYSYNDFVTNGICCSLENMELTYNSFIETYSNSSACPESDLPVFEACSMQLNPLEECVVTYYEYLEQLTAFNNSPWVIANDVSMKPQYENYTQFVNSGKCYCFNAYSDHLGTYIAASASASLPYPDNVYTFSGCKGEIYLQQDTCLQIYTSYLNAYTDFMQNSYSITACPNFTTTNPFMTYDEFVSEGVCCTKENMYDVLTTYINQFYSSSPCPSVALPSYSTCTPTQNMDIPCDDYDDYVNAIVTFNNSPWAIANSKSISTFYSLQEMIETGKCYCLPYYIDYLQDYISASASATMPTFIDNLKNFTACGFTIPEEESVCEALYNRYLAGYARFLTAGTGLCTPSQTPTPLITYQEFIDKGVCCSFDRISTVYSTYVAQFYPPFACPTTPLTNYTNSCAFENDNPCLDQKANMLLKIKEFNNTPWAIANGIVLPYASQMLDAGAKIDVNCNCIGDYITYVNGFIISPPTYNPSSPNGPQSFTSFTGCSNADLNACESNYTTYLNCVNNFNDWAIINKFAMVNQSQIVSKELFVSNNLCDCLSDYCAFLNDAKNGDVSLFEFKVYSGLSEFCSKPTSSLQPCVTENPWIEIGDVPTGEFTDPCTEILTNTAIANAHNAYSQYIDSLIGNVTQKYIDHCMGAVESFSKKYTDREYHRTLYYYDQAGNLIRTVPPEGVELVNTTSDTDAIGLQLKADRLNRTHTVLTQHRMTTTYEYNSLNQLIRQVTPDQDKMDIWDVTYPNGLQVGLNTTAIQMISENVGFLSGYVTTSSTRRGYLYKTTNGGTNWSKVDNLIAADLEKIKMVNATVGYAVGSHGVALKTTNGGASWDLLNLSYLGVNDNIKELHFISTTTGKLITRTGTILSTTDGGATFTSNLMNIANIGINGISDVYSMSHDGTNYLYSVRINEIGYSYNAIIRANNADVASVEKITATNLKAVDHYNSDEGFVVGDNGLIIKNFNSTYKRQALVDYKDGGDFEKAYFISAQRGVALRKAVGAVESELVYTVDGGENWVVLEGVEGYKDLALLQKYTTHLYAYALTFSGKIERILLSADAVNPIAKLLMTTNSSFAANSGTYNAFTTIHPVATNGSQHILLAAKSDGKIYQSQALNAQSVAVNFVNFVQLNPSNLTEKVQQLEAVIASNNSMTGVIQSQTGKLYSLYAAISTGTITINSLTTSGQSNPKITALTKDVAGNRAFAYEENAKKLHLIEFNTTSAPTSTTVQNDPIDFGSGTNIVAMAYRSNRITLVSTNGDVYGINNVATYSFAVATLYHNRSYLGTNQINHLFKSSGSHTNWMAVGNNGRFLERFITSSDTVWKIFPIGEQAHLKGMASIGNKHIIVGNNGFVKEFDRTTLTTTETTISNHNNVAASTIYSGVHFNAVAATTEGTYIVGSNGTVLTASAGISDNFYGYTTGYNGTFKSVAIFGGFIYSTQPKAYAVGANSTIYRIIGSAASKITNLFSDSISDVHFYSSNSGTVVGHGLFVRQTTDGGATWSVVTSDLNVTTEKIRKVWTKENNRAILVGDDFLGTIVDGIVYNNSFTGSIRAITFKNNGIADGYVAIGSTVRKLTYAFQPSTNTINLTLGTTYTGSAQVNALKVFPNGSVMAVGNNSFIGYLNLAAGATTFTAMPTGVSNEKYNTLFFHDYQNGYVAGDKGVVYQLKNTTFNTTTNTYTDFAWLAKENDVFEGIAANSSTERVDIKAMAFATRSKGVFGGVYRSTYVHTSPKAYVRLVSDESGQYGTRFYYDRLGRLVISQNARQYREHKFSYTLYDALGRVFEAGEKSENTSGATNLSIFGTFVGGQEIASVIDDAKLATWIGGNGARKEVTRSYYDTVTIAGLPSTFVPKAENMRKRIAHVTYEALYDGNDQTFDHATHYDYDIHGNVQTLLQDNQAMAQDPLLVNQRFKRLDYNYDLVSGNVHRVNYESGKIDQWHHAYVYDADNRITDVYTSKNTPLVNPKYGQANAQNEPEISPLWQKDAHYSYYAHGPLARIELGEEKVQGTDYIYTLQGWLKGVNSNTLDPTRDPGKDGINLATNLFARDVVGFSLHYFANDYTGIGSGSGSFAAAQATTDLTSNSNDLYNGNIARMVTTITNPTTRQILPLGNAYRYDQLNRIKESRSFANLNFSSNSWGNGGSYDNKYYNAFTYEANGNILTQVRHNDAGQTIDNLTYRYQTDLNNKMIRNRLYHVNDAVSSATFNDDIDDMGIFVSTPAAINTDNNYSYDEEGRLIKDVQEEIANIEWRVDGKVKSITRPLSSQKKNLSFDYNAMGQRIAKHVMNANNELEKSTYYVLDAQGNTMSVYERAVDETQTSVYYYQAEKNIYGSSRLGMLKDSIYLMGSTNLTANMQTVQHITGNKLYELNNHLGNVLTTISDKPIPKSEGEELVDNNYDSGSNLDFNAWSPNSVSIQNGKLKATTHAIYSAISRDLTTVPGKMYRLKFSIDVNNQGGVSAYAYDVTLSQFLGRVKCYSNGDYVLEFMAKNTVTSLRFESYVNATRDFYIDNIVIEEVTNALYANNFEVNYTPMYSWGGNLSQENGRLKVMTTLQWANARYDMVTQPGVKYRVSFLYDLNAEGSIIPFARDIATNTTLTANTITYTGEYYFEFVATGTSTMIVFETPHNYARTFYIDNLFITFQSNTNASYDTGKEVEYFMADIRTAQDYSPFGVILDKRNFEVLETYQVNVVTQVPVAQDSTLISIEDYVHFTDFENPVISTQTLAANYMNVEDWTNFSGSQLSVVTLSGSKWMKIVSTNGTHGANKHIVLEPSTNYSFTFDLNLGLSSNVNVVVGTLGATNGINVIASMGYASSNTHTLYFTTPASLPTGVVIIQIRQTGTYYIDNVVIKKVATNQIIHSNNFETAVTYVNNTRTFYDGWYAAISVHGSVTANATMKRLQVDMGTAFDCLFKVVDVTPGTTYQFRAKIVGGEGGNIRIMQRAIGNTGAGTLLINPMITTNDGYVNISFTPTNTQVVFAINKYGTFYVEDVSITKQINKWKYTPTKHDKVVPIFTNATNITQIGADITSLPTTAGWGTTGAHSTQTINQGDYIEYEIGNDAVSNYYRSVVGLSYTPNGKDMGADYNFYISGSSGEHTIYTAGNGRTRYVTPFVIQNGNKYKIWRRNGNIEFYVNNTLDRSFVDQYPNRPMYLEIAFNDPNRKIKNLYIYKEVRKYYEEVITTQTLTKAGDYRYGFNGMEKDDEVKGLGNSYTTNFRQYDSRLGRWLSLDPLFQNFPWQSPYVAFDNNPILLVDPLGAASENGDKSKEPQGEDLDEVNIQGPEAKMNWFQRFVSKVKRAIGIGFTSSGKTKKQSKGTEFLSGMSLENHFGNGPSIGKEGKGVYYTDKDNPSYEEWEKGREQHKALENFVIDYMKTVMSLPLSGLGGGVIGAGILNGGINAGGNYLSQSLAVGGNKDEIDLASTTLAFASGFIPGRFAIAGNIGFGAADGVLDYKLSDGGFSNPFNKPIIQVIADASFATLGNLAYSSFNTNFLPVLLRPIPHAVSTVPLTIGNTLLNDNVINKK